jgi:hypothetical protein
MTYSKQLQCLYRAFLYQRITMEDQLRLLSDLIA